MRWYNQSVIETKRINLWLKKRRWNTAAYAVGTHLWPVWTLFLHTNDAAGYRAALALRRAGNENESDGTLWIFPPLPWTNHALDSAARVR